jgi:hypothetical protein
MGYANTCRLERSSTGFNTSGFAIVLQTLPRWLRKAAHSQSR